MRLPTIQPHDIGSDYQEEPQQATIIGTSSIETHLPKVLGSKLGQNYESKDTNVAIPISYYDNTTTSILDGGAKVA